MLVFCHWENKSYSKIGLFLKINNYSMWENKTERIRNLMKEVIPYFKILPYGCKAEMKKVRKRKKRTWGKWANILRDFSKPQ